MKTDLIALSPSRHRSHGWLRQDSYLFAAADVCAPVLLAELPVALGAYPLAFVKRPDGKAQLVVVQGLHAGQNLYVDVQGRWVTNYVPCHYRGYPFVLHNVEETQGSEKRVALCFNRQSGLYREQPDPAMNEARFFDDEGKLPALMQELANFLQSCLGRQQQTQMAVDALEAAGLLQPWVLPESLTAGSDEPLVQGLFLINEAALNGLNAEQLLTLHKANALPAAYAQLLSMPRIGLLQQLAQLRQKALAEQASAAASPDFSIAQKLFDPTQSDTLHFNF